MSRIYIVGNGVDLYYGLKTNIDSFVNILKRKKINGIINLGEFYETYGINWSDFEGSLSYFNYENLLFDNIIYPDYSSDHESDRDEGIIMINSLTKDVVESTYDAIGEMVKNANKNINSLLFDKKGYIKLKDNDLIINFNYTDTIMYMPSIIDYSNVLYIHGQYSQNERLIYGYLDAKSRLKFDTEEDYYLETQKDIVENFKQAFKKQIQKEKLQVFLENHKRCDEVIVLGHSLSEIDKIYFSMVNDIYNPKKWYISYIKNNRTNMLEKESKISDYSFIKNYFLINCEDFIKKI